MHCLYNYRLWNCLFLFPMELQIWQPLIVPIQLQTLAKPYFILLIQLHVLETFFFAHGVTDSGNLRLSLYNYRLWHILAHLCAPPYRVTNSCYLSFSIQSYRLQNSFILSYGVIDSGYLSFCTMGLQILVNIYSYLVESQTLVTSLVLTMISQILWLIIIIS